MRIEHAAVWVHDLEAVRRFYETYFHAEAGAKYANEAKQFESYFLTFDGGARLEIMRRADIDQKGREDTAGWAHIAISLGSQEAVDTLTAEIEHAGYPLRSGPRTTGDGYYESVIEDPEGNVIELTI
ncbi:VOC family protein [Alkalicoccus chagannorensis]|uniref:VOC family protein n=1 Tax=Alkalicoccus chagannorensis TaxID=427072 RepID=UPI000403A54B|nr:VOC family protein [Alkalicoccus chagannorensis]